MDMLRNYEELSTRDKIKFFLGLEKFYTTTKTVLETESIVDEHNELRTFIEVVTGKSITSSPNVPEKSQKTLDTWIFKSSHPSSNLLQQRDESSRDKNQNNTSSSVEVNVNDTSVLVESHCDSSAVCTDVIRRSDDQQKTLSEHEFSLRESGYVVAKNRAPKTTVDSCNESVETETPEIYELGTKRSKTKNASIQRPSKVHYNLRTKIKASKTNFDNETIEGSPCSSKDSVPSEDAEIIFADVQKLDRKFSQGLDGPRNGDVRWQEQLLQNNLNGVITEAYDTSIGLSHVKAAKIITKEVSVLLHKNEALMDHFIRNVKKHSPEKGKNIRLDNTNSSNFMKIVDTDNESATEESSVHDKIQALSKKRKKRIKLDNPELCNFVEIADNDGESATEELPMLDKTQVSPKKMKKMTELYNTENYNTLKNADNDCESATGESLIPDKTQASPKKTRKRTKLDNIENFNFVTIADNDSESAPEKSSIPDKAQTSPKKTRKRTKLDCKEIRNSVKMGDNDCESATEESFIPDKSQASPKKTRKKTKHDNTENFNSVVIADNDIRSATEKSSVLDKTQSLLKKRRKLDNTEHCDSVAIPSNDDESATEESSIPDKTQISTKKKRRRIKLDDTENCNLVKIADSFSKSSNEGFPHNKTLETFECKSHKKGMKIDNAKTDNTIKIASNESESSAEEPLVHDETQASSEQKAKRESYIIDNFNSVNIANNISESTTKESVHDETQMCLTQNMQKEKFAGQRTGKYPKINKDSESSNTVILSVNDKTQTSLTQNLQIHSITQKGTSNKITEFHKCHIAKDVVTHVKTKASNPRNKQMDKVAKQNPSPKCDLQSHGVNQRQKPKSNSKEKGVMVSKIKPQKKTVIASTQLSNTSNKKNKRKNNYNGGCKTDSKDISNSVNCESKSLISGHTFMLVTEDVKEHINSVKNDETKHILGKSKECDIITENPEGCLTVNSLEDYTKHTSSNLAQFDKIDIKNQNSEECSAQNSFDDKAAEALLSQQKNAYCIIEHNCAEIGLSAADIFKTKEINDLLTKREGLSQDSLLFIGSYKCSRTEKNLPVVHVHKSKAELWDALCIINNDT